jgi:hypothetical protein
MAIRIRPAAELANKFRTRAQAAAPDYKVGVEQAGGDWETNAAASESNYDAGVQAAIGRKAFGKGVRASGAAHYVKRASGDGAVRYGPGIASGTERWTANTQPYLQALASMTLPPRGPRRSPANQQRANFVAAELGKMAENK